MGGSMTKVRLKYIHEYRRTNGDLVRYVRRPGWPKVTLPGLPGTPEFMEAYAAAMSGETPPSKINKTALAGSLAELVLRYYASPRFDNRSPQTKRLYRHVLEKHIARDGNRLVSQLTAEKAEKIVIEVANERGKGAANLHRSVLSAVFRYAVRLRMRPDNPFSVDIIEPYDLGERHTWTDGELKAYRDCWPLGTRERLAFAVLLYSGQRVSDAVRLTRADVLSFKQRKTGADLSIPAHPALVRAVKAGPSNGLYIIGDEAGRPIKAETLTRLIRRAAKKAGLPAQCKAHGLRKANQRLLAEAGATTKQMQAISGHRTLKETERYSEKANQASMAAAAIALLPDEM